MKVNISSKDTRKPLKGALFELSGSDYKHDAPLENDELTVKSSDPPSSEALSSADLVTAATYVWNRARQPLSVLLPKTSSVYKPEIIQEGGNEIYSTDRGTCAASTSYNEKVSVNLAKENEPNQMNTHPHLSYEYSPFWSMLLRRETPEPFFENCVFRAGNLPAFGGIYGWVHETTRSMPERESPVLTAGERTIKFYGDECLTNPATSSSIRDLYCNLEVENSVDMRSGEVSDSKVKDMCLENHMIHAEHVEGSGSGVDVDVHEPNFSTLSCDCSSGTKPTDDLDHEIQKENMTPSNIDSSELEPNMPAKKKKTLYTLAKHEHAFAGATAGIFVSLCLHPVDTIKTVVQSCCADKRSLSYVSRSIVSERGLGGLYRGISTHIVASAPISALYTFTYESAKKSFVPLLPKEYNSLAHCMAGASASIATSFIFTPSERIKQQMQVCSHYRNTWNALRVIVEKGGLPSLYAGWGAVLCRNIPHSVIKFYTYESLKQAMLPSDQPNAQPTTIVSLVCGGLAATTASLFSTPFDVVKTRLQTQIPGSVTRYNGVLNTLVDIGKSEGLKGLYRGLTPRLVMYMIHGALFFASYESFKQLFLSEVSQSSSQKMDHGEAQDVSMITPQLASVSA